MVKSDTLQVCSNANLMMVKSNMYRKELDLQYFLGFNTLRGKTKWGYFKVTPDMYNVSTSDNASLLELTIFSMFTYESIIYRD